MAAQVFWAVFYSSRLLSQIGPTADFDGAAIPPPIFSMTNHIVGLSPSNFEMFHWACLTAKANERQELHSFAKGRGRP